jgi:4'-phosphopantetheinyl transferase EntD
VSTIAIELANLSTELSGLFPPGTLAADLRGVAETSVLYPEEAAYVQASAPIRAQEFAAGRLCARRLLHEFGIDNFPIRVGDNRQPVWPDSLVGSITHTAGFCAAVAARKRDLRALGIDAELDGSVKPELQHRICTPDETAWLGSLPEAERTSAATLIFSAKEAFYKCQYSITQERLGFSAAVIEVPAWGLAQGSFVIHANQPLALQRTAPQPLQGRYLFREQIVVAGIALAAADQ